MAMQDFIKKQENQLTWLNESVLSPRIRARK